MKYLGIACGLLIVLSIFALPVEQVAASSHQSCFLGFCWDTGNINTTPPTSGSGAPTSGSSGGVTSLQQFIMFLGYFINNALIPLILGIALLVFLVNAVRYFIIGGDSEDGRDKARKLMLYGIAAFVFIVSLWGIVNLIVNGLNLDYEQSICPDYLPSCGNNNPRGSIFVDAPGRTPIDSGRGPGSGQTGSTGGTTGTGGTVSSGSGTTNQCGTGTAVSSGLSDLVFGTYQDVSSLVFANPTAALTGSTPNISSTETCFNALNTLQLASSVETNQIGYVLYTDSTGVRRWQNVTDTNSINSIGYNANDIAAIKAAGGTNMYLIHTHHSNTAGLTGLSLQGQPPSAADMALLCDPLLTGVTHVTVDWNHIWVMTQPSNTCPRTGSETYEFPIAESLLMLSQVTQGSRNQEYYDLSNAAQVPSQYRNALSGYCSVDFDSYTDLIVGGTANQSLAAANLSVQRQDINAFCSSI